MTAREIALAALAQLGEDASPDPITQIRDIAAQATATLNATQLDARQLAALIHEDPHALETSLTYEHALDRAHTALTAAAQIDHAQRMAAALQRIADQVLAGYPEHHPETE